MNPFERHTVKYNLRCVYQYDLQQNTYGKWVSVRNSGRLIKIQHVSIFGRLQLKRIHAERSEFNEWNQLSKSKFKYHCKVGIFKSLVVEAKSELHIYDVYVLTGRHNNVCRQGQAHGEASYGCHIIGLPAHDTVIIFRRVHDAGFGSQNHRLGARNTTKRRVADQINRGSIMMFNKTCSIDNVRK